MLDGIAGAPGIHNPLISFEAFETITRIDGACSCRCHSAFWPRSVVGPPLSVAITPDESLALVANSTQIDPGDKSKTIPDDKVSVIDLRNRKVLNRIATGAGAAGLSITKSGKLAFVANRMAGSISILSIDGLAVRLVRTEPVAKPASLLSHVAVAPDSATGVATLSGEAKVMVAPASLKT